MADRASAAILIWSKIRTHCAVCLRPFAKRPQVDAHQDQECEPQKCWCEDFCWVDEGGDCIGPSDDDPQDEMSMWVELRGLQERVDDGSSREVQSDG